MISTSLGYPRAPEEVAIQAQSANDVPTGTTLKAELCIIGSGPAGMTVARHFVGKGRDVLVLEAGGRAADDESQDVYKGEMLTLHRGERDKKYPHVSRIRAWGGSSAHWAGWCRPLEPEDFAARDWVPHSGWPIGPEALAPYYGKAARMVAVYPFDQPIPPPLLQSRPALELGPDVLTRDYYFSSPPTRFAEAYGPQLEADPDVRILFHANVTALRAEGEGETGRVSRIEVKTFGGNTLTVEAQHVVLACGGIENARVLLLSDQDRPQGLGNHSDKVGRFFADHPHVPDPFMAMMVGAQTAEKRPIDRYYKRRTEQLLGCRRMGLFALSPEVQEREKLLNATIMLRKFGETEPNAVGKAVGRLAADQARLAGSATADPGLDCVFFVCTEQQPNPDSRITLDPDEKDALGNRRVRVDWQMSDADAHTVRRTCELVGDALSAGGFARVRDQMSRTDPYETLRGGNHHLGTTRMSLDPGDGVVDANCRVHGLDNLFIAGSSVFPTYGCANPTLSIVAMALRLAEHLETEVLG